MIHIVLFSQCFRFMHIDISISLLLFKWHSSLLLFKKVYGFGYILLFEIFTGENLDAVTAVTDSFKMADTFAGDRTGGAVARTSARTIGISVWQDRVGVSLLQGNHGSGCWVVVRAKSAIVYPRDAAVIAPLFTAMVQ